MKVQIASDIHLEHWTDHGLDITEEGRFTPVLDRDLLVLAGDIHVGTGAMDFIQEELCISPVIYVPGNHEYYTFQTREYVNDCWEELAGEYRDFHFLTNGSVTIKGKVFYGTPLFSDLSAPGDVEYFGNRINDFRKGATLSGWSVQDHTYSHMEAVYYLEKAVEAGLSIDMVITHFPVTLEAEDKRYQGSPSTKYYINNLPYLVKKVAPKYWISGHTHSCFEYKIGDTVCLGNPGGYPFEEETPGFQPDRVVEV